MTARRVLLFVAVTAAAVLAAHPVLARTVFVRSSAPVVIGVSTPGPIVSLSNARPGASASGSFRVTNRGTSRGIFTIGPTTTGSAALAKRLRLTLSTSEGGRLYAGSLAAARTVRIGALARGTGRTVVARLSFPAGAPAADNALQGQRLGVAFRVSAVQG